jgi:hypothetical protein
MPLFAFRVFTDRLKPGALAGPLRPMPRAIYVCEGDAVVSDGASRHTIARNEARFHDTELAMRAGTGGAHILRFELAPKDADPEGRATAAGVRSEGTFAREVALHPWTPQLMRCDRVDFPPRGQALTHIHPGPGVRCMVLGRLAIRQHGRETAYDAGQAWFEPGPDPVLAEVVDGPAAFVRVMVLPRALRDANSIHYLLPEDAARPKSQQYTRFFDHDIDL